MAKQIKKVGTERDPDDLKLRDDLKMGRAYGLSPTLSLAIGGGLSEGMSLEGELSSTRLLAQNVCKRCDAWSTQAGVALTYRLARDLAIDPWVRYGLGAVWLHRDNAKAQLETSNGLQSLPRDAFGLEWARLSLGANYRPVAVFGFGPVLSANLGHAWLPDADNAAKRRATFTGALLAGLEFVWYPKNRPAGQTP